MNRAFLIILTGVLVFASAVKPARGVSQMSEEDIFAFAENLFLQKDYYRAITEYSRQLFFYPSGKNSGQARFKIAKSYQLGGKYNIAMDQFDKLSSAYRGRELGKLCEFESAETLYRNGDYISASEVYKKFSEVGEYPAYADPALYRTGLSRLHLRQVAAAIDSFKLIKPSSSLFSISNQMTDKASEFRSMKRKSPFLAGLLSAVVPGAGQFYNGRVKDGIIALITNGLFIWGSYEAYRREYYSIGIVTSVFALGWYSGNVFGAVNGAHKYNFNKESVFFEGLKERYEFLGDELPR